MPTKDTRKHQRFKRRFRVMLVSDNRTFRTFSSDVSLGGFRLEKKVPGNIIGRACRVLIGRMDNRENIELHCELLGDTQEPERAKFVGLNQQSLEILQRWINENGDEKAA